MLLAALFPTATWAAEPVPRSVLILDQSDAESAWYAAFSPAFRSTLRSGSERPISVYSEHLDLSRFPTADHDKARRNYLRDKFRDRSIGVLVAQGSSALEFVMRSRADLWPGVPVVFASLDAATAARLNLPPDVTGTIRQLTFRNTVITAQALVPDLKRIALVGDAWERQAVRRQYKDELPAFAAKFEIIDLIGLPMTEIRKRVAVLPDNTAIIYTAVNLDGAGVAYRPHEALAAIAEVANRPVVIDVETNIGHGGTGGLVSHPALIGQDAARIALRIINGERPSDIPITEGDVIKPVFDWRQLQRFGISESRLPPGSEIRFRSPTVWQQYRWQMIALVSALLLQGALITWLLFERYRRHRAELESRRRLLEVIHLNRTAAAGALSASFAHELNQPLGAILSNAETAEALLSANPPDLEQLKEILADIRRDDQRAADIIDHLRGLLRRKNDAELREFDLNEVVRGGGAPARSRGDDEGRRAGRQSGAGHVAGARRRGPPAAGRVESGHERDGCHAELRSRLAQHQFGDRIGRRRRGGGVGVRFRYRHSERQAEGDFRDILYDQAAGHRAWIVDRAHDHRDLRRENLGGEPKRRRRGVSLHPAIDQGADRMTTDAPVIHIVDDDELFRTWSSACCGISRNASLDEHDPLNLDLYGVVLRRSRGDVTGVCVAPRVTQGNCAGCGPVPGGHLGRGVPRSVLILDHTNSVAALDQAFRVTLNARPELQHGPFCR